MKTQLSKPARAKARYTDESKEQALALWRRFGRKEIRQDEGLARTAAPKHNPAISKLVDEFPKWGKVYLTRRAGRC